MPLDEALPQETSDEHLPSLLADVEHLGAYRVIRVDANLSFPEPNFALMKYRSKATIEAVAPLRFVERRYHWSGSGIQNPPRILAQSCVGGELHPVKHGPIYSVGTDKAFLIDLGKHVDAGEEVDVQVEIQFIDEDGVFKPFYSRTAGPFLKQLSLSVSFERPPTECFHTFRRNSDSEWSPRVAIQAVEDGGMQSFRFNEEPARRGKHKLVWGELA